MAKAMRGSDPSKEVLDELHRAEEVLPVYKTDWHVVFLQCSYTVILR